MRAGRADHGKGGRVKGAVLLALAVLLLAGCGSGGRTSVVYDGDAGRLQSFDAQGRPVSGPGIHTVRRGETLSEIAARYGVGTETLAAVNGLDRPDLLRVGQRLRIPVTRRYTVERGDTVYSIARRYGVPIRAVIEVNGLAPPYELEVGQALTLPQPRVHIVRDGDTLYGVSQRYEVGLRELARLNGLDPPYTITPGQELALPSSQAPAGRVQVAGRGPGGGAESERSASAQPATNGAGRGASSRSGSKSRASQGASARAATGRPPPPPGRKPAAVVRQARASNPEPARDERPSAVPQPEARSASRFAWPLRGEILVAYGAQEGGLHNDGINIAARQGAPVRAAENGVVAYVGNELRGFGNLVLVKHADDWITAYAHLDSIAVERGARVRRGAVIGRAGRSGNVARPQLHFETRRGSKAIDPTTVLATAQARASL